MGRRVIILAYHRVCPKADTNPILWDTIVEPELFDKQMLFLSKRFNVVPLDYFLDATQSRKRLPKNTVVITFDDAYRDNFVYAFPILKKYGFPATLFVATAFIDDKRPFWWDSLAHILSCANTKTATFTYNQNTYKLKLPTAKDKKEAFYLLSHDFKKSGLTEQNDLLDNLSFSSGSKRIEIGPDLLTWEEMRTMLKEGMCFGAHGHTHRAFSVLNTHQISDELRISKELLRLNLGISKVSLAYPFGEEHDFDRELMPALLQEADYRCALTMLQGAVGCGDGIYALNRIGIGYQDTHLKFCLKLNGIIPRLSKLKKELYGIISNN